MTSCPVSTNAATDNKFLLHRCNRRFRKCVLNRSFKHYWFCCATSHGFLGSMLSGMVAHCVACIYGYFSSRVKSERLVRCVRLSTERKQPQSSNHASVSGSGCCSLLRATGPVIFTSLTFFNDCDAFAISCIVTRFHISSSSQCSASQVDSWHLWILYPCCRCLAFLALPAASSFLLLPDQQSQIRCPGFPQL